jgi:hypothetical protein
MPGYAVNEPANHTAWIDTDGDAWVRVDDCPGPRGTWWQICDGPYWGTTGGHAAFGGAQEWDEVEEYGPFAAADPDRTAAAIDLVRRAVTS